MRSFFQRAVNLLRGHLGQRTRLRKRPGSLRARLEVLQLEDRVVPASSGLGTVSGMVFLADQMPAPGVQVRLTGQSNQGAAVEMAVTSDASGAFAFRSIKAGTYQVDTSGQSFFVSEDPVSGVIVLAGQNTVANVGVGGLAPGAISRRMFLTTSTDLSFFEPAGPTSNTAPFVQIPIAQTIIATNATQTIDLAAHFLDLDRTRSEVIFHTSDGDMKVILGDDVAPQTVANFFDYVQSGRYDNTIFHRLDTTPPVLQGGGFSLGTDITGHVTSFPAVTTPGDPALQNEFVGSFPDSLGTLAMAKKMGDPNSATSEFFFNLADNSGSLGPTNNGGFTVFGAVASDATSQAVFAALQNTPVFPEGTTNSAFGTLPLNNFSGSGFPTSTTPSNYLVVNGIEVIKRDESLSYSVVSSSDPSVATGQFVSTHPEVLVLQAGGHAGTTTITVKATDLFGASVTTSFDVVVVPLSITSATNPVNISNQTNATVTGTTAVGATVSVTASNGSTATTPVTATVDGSGNWTASGINVTTLPDGTITYTAAATDTAGHTAKLSRTATKDTIAPAIAVTTVPASINAANQANTSASGTTEVGATVSVFATNGTLTSASVMATVDGSGNWTATGIDVSGLPAGTITYSATATDAAGNTASASKMTTKT